jgi:diguanylate cyclase (GGDEF)-like protein
VALDLSTLYVVAGLGMLVAGFIHLIPVSTGRFGRWAALWGSGHLVVGCGAIIAILNDRIGISWAPNIGNPLAVIGYTLITAAVMKFDRAEIRLTPLLAIAGLLAAPTLICGDAEHFHLRVAYLSIVRAGFDIVVVIVAIRLARREALQTAWIVATLFAITVPLFLGRGWLAYEDRIGVRLTGMHDDLGAWLAAGQIAFVIFRAFSLLILQAERGQNALLDQLQRDSLTGALNRVGFNRIAVDLAGRSKRLTAMMLDIDRFKALNDTYGHAAGDAALRSLADIIHVAINKKGYLARWGGDEFICLLPDVNIDIARATASGIARQFADAMIGYGPTNAGPSVSIGTVEGDAARAIADLVVLADQAMYAAKADLHRELDAGRKVLRAVAAA